MTATPSISVVMSIFNGENFIRESVESIINQSFDDYEFIIIDDGSTDKGLKLLEEYANLHPSISLIKRKHSGLTKSLIFGCNSAKGKYIARQDVDDYSDPDRLQLQFDRLENDDNLVLIGSWYEVLDEKNISVVKKPIDNDKIIKRFMFYNNPFCHSSVMFRKESYHKTFGYDITYETSQDLDLWFKLAIIGKVAMVEQILVKRKIHKDNISKSKNAWIQVKNSFRIRKKYLHAFDKRSSIHIIYIASLYQLLMAFLPTVLSKKVSRLVRFNKLL